MYEIVEGIHRALNIHSRWAFVLTIAIGSALVGGFFAYIIDTGYRHSAEYRADHPEEEPSPKSQAATNQGQTQNQNPNEPKPSVAANEHPKKSANKPEVSKQTTDKDCQSVAMEIGDKVNVNDVQRLPGTPLKVSDSRRS